MQTKNPKFFGMTLTILAILSMLLAACQSAEPTVVEAPPTEVPPTPAPTMETFDVAAMQNIEWVLGAYGDPANPTVPPRDIRITALFAPDGTLSGFGGCNNFNTSYTANSDGSLVVDPVIATTMMACPDEQMEAEQAFLQALSMTQSFGFAPGGGLTITFGYSGIEDTGLLVFAKGAVPLVNTPWVLVSIGDPAAPTPIQPGVFITAQFDEDGRVSGSAGCNSYTAGFEVDGEQLTVLQVASTAMECLSGMEQETFYLQAFDVARSYSILGQTLTITYSDPEQDLEGVLIYTSASMPLEGTLWTLAAVDGTVIDTAVAQTAVFEPGEDPGSGTVGGLAGCNNYNGGYTVDGENLTIGPLASTMMMCEEDAMQSEQAFLQALQTAQTYSILGDSLNILTESGTFTFRAGRTPLTGALWQLTSLGDVENPESPVAGANFTAQFLHNPQTQTPAGVLSGTTGCNEYSAAYAATLTGMKVNLPVSTGSATCAPGLSSQEELYFLALNNVTTYRILGETLVMPYDDGKQALVFHATQLGVAERPPLSELDGSRWYLWSIDDRPVANGTTITAQLTVNPDGSSGQMTGSAGCNTYNAAFGEGLGIETTLTSRQFCGQPQSVMAQETTYVDVLSRGFGYWQSGSQFILNSGAGVLTYQNIPPASSGDQAHLLVDRNWFLVSFNTSMSSPGTQEPFARFNSDGTVTGFTGCNQFNGTYSTNLSQLTFSQIATTLTACTSTALQNQETAILAMLNSPQSYQVFNTSLQISGTTGVFNYSLTPLSRPEEAAVPVAVINAAVEARVNTPVTFDGSSSTSDLPLVRFSWDFGDGGRSTGAIVQHVYSRPGQYRVLLSVFDEANQGNTASHNITIVVPNVPTPTPVPEQPTVVPPTEAPPTAVPPTQVPPTGVPPTEVPPTAVPPTAVPPTAVPPTEVPPTEVPPTEEPNVPPTAAVQGPRAGFIAEPVSFSAAGSTPGSSPIVSYQWDFGDGGGSPASPNPDTTYLYNHAGSYQVTVIVTDQRGLSSSASTQINIDARLDTTVWTLDRVNPGTAITLQFLRGQLTGFAGCNTYNGSYTAVDNGDGTFTVTPNGTISTTNLACPQSIMDQEKAYLASLQQVTTAVIQGNVLTLTGGSPLVYYEAGTPRPR